MKEIDVGVLALQGDFKEHVKILEKMGISASEVRSPGQLSGIDGLIIPGGESTTINKLLDKYKFRKELNRFIRSNKPVFGTCAGLILLADKVKGENSGLGLIDMDVERNAYGRQIDSFEEEISINLNHKPEPERFKSIFIRAPKITRTGEKVRILSKHKDEVVLARENNILVCAFHPELTEDTRIHEYFIEMINDSLEER